MKFNIPEFTVSEFSRSIKTLVEDAFGYIRIKGEITSFKRATSGHLYFSLKDEAATLSAVCFRNSAQAINFEIADGLQVTASGRITTFEGRSNYQIIIEKLEIAGIGAVLEMIEKRRQKLLAEGLFDNIHKKPIPFFPRIIGVITSPTGAVIEDIKHRIAGRCPSHILLYPTLVQGDKAAFEIINAIRFFNKLDRLKRPEVIIIARGGGSFEDLIIFNDEQLIREVFKSEIPIISAIGHESDVTLIDYVADLRAPTPSAAAEFATPVLSDLKNQLSFLDNRMEVLSKNYLEEKLQNIKNLQRYIISPAKIFDQIFEKFSFLEVRLDSLVKNLFAKKIQKLSSLEISNQLIFQHIDLTKQKIDFWFKRAKSSCENALRENQIAIKNLEKFLKANHYNEILKRGFSLVRNKNGDIISSTSKVEINEKIIIEMFDGKIETIVNSK